MVIKAGSHTLEKWTTTTTKKTQELVLWKSKSGEKEEYKNANYRETPNYDRKLKGL